ncbi:hypothetical protein EC991_010372 [Linnemannia zychae]|nr:hypothetical protein EC991_010372 [Linnemannia zychae]
MSCGDYFNAPIRVFLFKQLSSRQTLRSNSNTISAVSTRTRNMANTTPMQQLGLMDIDDGDRNNTEHARKRAKLHESTDVPTFGDEELRNNPSNQSLSIVHAPQGTDSPLVASIAAGPPVVSSSSNVDTPMPIRSPEENQEPSVIFLANLPKVVVKTPLPVLEDRIERTEQLVYCNTLLLQAERARNTTNNVMQIESTLTEKELEWLTEMDKNPMEKEHIRSLPTVMVEEFIQGGVKDSIEIAEIVSLAPVLDRENYRNLLSHFIESFEDAHSLNVDILHGLVQLVQSALPGYLTSDDFVRIVGIFRIHLQGTHKQQLEHTFHLTLAMSRILDIMTERRAKDPYRTEECELLYGVLLGLDSTSDPHLMYQVCYALQALQYVSGEEAALQAVLHHSTNDVAGLANDSAAFELDIGVVFEGLVNLQGTLTGVIDTAAADYGGANSLLESGRGILESLKEGLGSGQIRPWYLAIRAASALAKARQLKDLSQLIYEAPCRCDPFFQWGICQLLGEIASDTIWDTIVRRQAINHLGELYKNDAKAEWGQDESVKFWMLNIISRLGTVEDQGIKEAAHSLLQELKHDQDTAPSIPFPLSNRFPVPKFSPTLARVQNIPYVEYYLHKLRLLQLEEHRRGIYVSLLAKPNLHANNDTCFPLMEKAMEFLAGHCQVFLLLGDSGAGKSTFSRELEHTLWKNYSKGEPIPLYINLSYIDDPSQELIEKHLRYFNFSSEEIQEMKVQREFVLICDGYDEIQLKINLYSKNLFNQLGQWKVKMVVSCRSQYLGKDYRLWFQPQQSDRYQRSTTNLLEEAVIAPFSRDQVREYVEEHVHRRHAIDPLQVQSSWAVEEYMDKLINIPNLMDLVSNPFLLTLALDSLPSVVESEKELSMIRITRVQLYDSFTVRWLKVNHARLKEIQLSETERSELNSLADGNFLHHGIQFQKDLSTAIFMMSIVDEPSIVQFLAERVQQDAYFQQQLLETIEESKTDISTAFTATNSITILVRANIFFNGADLRGVKIPGADLSGGHYKGPT